MGEPQQERRAAFEPWSPVRCEEEIARLMNAVAQAEIAMRGLREAEADAEYEYARAETIAALHPECPIPTRGGATVGERESFIKGMCEDELRGLIYHKLNVTNQKSYMQRLEQQCSLVQTMSKLVMQAYDVAGARGRGGH